MRASWWYCAPRNGHCSTFAERTLALAAARLNMLFHRGGTLLFRPRDAKNAGEIVRRINSPGPFIAIALGVTDAADIRGLHHAEQGDGRPFRWTATDTHHWTVDVKSDTEAVVQVRIPYLMEISRVLRPNARLALMAGPRRFAFRSRRLSPNWAVLAPARSSSH